MKQTWNIGSLILIALMMVGCPSESERLANMADQSVRMQAEQNVQAANTHKEFAQLQRDLQTERNELNQQLKTLEDDRRALHRERKSELAWAESFRFLAIVIAAVTPLFLCAYLIWAATRQSSCHESVNELLIQEFVSPEPRFIGTANVRAIEHTPMSKTPNPTTTEKIQNMSHVVLIKTEVRDFTAVKRACSRLKLDEPVHGTFQLYGSQETGCGVHLRDWKYPIICKLETGELRYDDHGGRWGNAQRLDEFLQGYAVERAKLEARKQGYTASEQLLADGSIKVTINAGGDV